MLNKSLAVGIVFLFVFSTVTSMVLGNDIESEVQTQATAAISSGGPMNSPWPMQCHDTHHTGRSPYSTADNPGIEKWRFKGYTLASPVIGDDCTIYVGDTNYYLYALNPDGTEKWKYKTGGQITSSPAIDEDGTIYVCSWDCRIYALNPNGTLKWKVGVGGSISSSPAIAEDGTIYLGTLGGFEHGGYITAVSPNGTLKWRYETGDDINEGITSDPAIGDDGTIYIGSMDNYLYALYSNGTLRWRFETQDEVHGHPSIASDGTIYFGSYDDYLYALHPNGTMKWKFYTSWGTCGNPSIGEDGVIYVGTDKLYAIYPNGTQKWGFDLGPDQEIAFSSPAISADGAIYVGTEIYYGGSSHGGDIIAVNPDGTEKWRKRISTYWVHSSPCIGEDGTAYIGSTYDQGRGYLHAFDSVESNSPPEAPTITGETNGTVDEEYWYGISAVDPDNNPVSIYIEWGDSTNSGWNREQASGEKYYYEHTWSIEDMYTIRAKAKDVMGEESDWGTLEVSMPKNKLINPFERFLENHPYIFPLLRKILAR